MTSRPGRPRIRPTGSHAGFTLVELIIGLVVFGLIVTATLASLSGQTSAFRGGLDRMVGLQTARFSIQTLELDLPTAGTNVPPGQPRLVYAGEDVFAFHADYASNTGSDPFTVYHDPGAPGSTVVAPTTAITIPGTSFQYPDTTYMEGGAVSPAELIIFFFASDTTTSRSDDFALYRQVNDESPELVARHMLKPEGQPFFRYMTVGDSAIDSIAAASLPLRHTQVLHGQGADTGSVALVDSVRAIRVSLEATNNWTGSAERTVELARLIRLPNVLTAQIEACGSMPILGTGITAANVATASGDPAVRLTWNRATDEGGGEDDVVRYVVWRRETGTTGWSDPYLSIPAGPTSYEYVDAAVEPGVTYVYGLAAQDCTPSLSTVAQSGTVTVPTP